jgi:A/G-specific adenine glycosylase
MRQTERIKGFVEVIWDWYALHKRRLPWRDLAVRDDTERAYRILVSEVMLQQTQVERVKTIFVRFLEQFPTLKDLASASNKQVILAWRGMGYNSRALRLRDAARHIIEKYKVQGTQYRVRFPKTTEELAAIPGIGHYTAAAILNFAFNIPTPCIDTNIRRILHRTFYGSENSDGSWRVKDPVLLKLARDVLEEAVNEFAAKRGSRGPHAGAAPLREKRVRERKTAGLSLTPSNWHAALMDFGSLVQTKSNPKWEECPLTARGLMKATAKNSPNPESRIPKSEPGRTISGRFTPNRIIRGRIIEALRDEAGGLSPAEIGRRVCTDWSERQHKKWLQEILAKLKSDALIARRSNTFVLAD